MIALAYLLGGIVEMLAGGSIALGVWLRSSHKETSNARDVILSQADQLAQLRADLERTTITLATTTKQLAETEVRLRAAESQRNAAYYEARDLYVKRIEESGMAGAGELVANLLRRPLGVQDVVPEARRSEDGRDSLLNPEL